MSSSLSPQSSVLSPPYIDFGRDICSRLPAAEQREWLITNGIGGYAMGTISGINTQKYHGLLIAALKPPVNRWLMLSRIEDTAYYNRESYPLFASRRQRKNGRYVHPQGFLNLERFHLEGTTPVWTYVFADAQLEKRIWMQPGANTTYIRYTLKRATVPLTLRPTVFVNNRDHHGNTHTDDLTYNIQPHGSGFAVTAAPDAVPFYVQSADTEEIILWRPRWQRDYYLSVEAARGLDPLDDHLKVADFHAVLREGDSLLIVASTDPNPNLDPVTAWEARESYERDLLQRAGMADKPGTPQAQLTLAADQFIVRRTLPDGESGYSVIAGYPWFEDWGRDTMISLSGLTLATERPEIAARILRTFAHYVDRGMLPNRFPDAGAAPEYNTVDAGLWYFEAIRAYDAATGDETLLRDLFPTLKDMIRWHTEGTRYGIQVDPADGLLRAGEAGVQLTWMDVKIRDWVVTPRTGKAVEINALWYNALLNIAAFAERLNDPDAPLYRAMAERVRTSFARFWNPQLGYCYDVLDCPDGTNDSILRPNQLIAVALPQTPLTPDQMRQVVDICARELLTSHGLRSLTPKHPDFKGRYGGDQAQRDATYHQGTVWGWLIGPFVSAYLRAYGDKTRAAEYLTPLYLHLKDHGLGTISEIFEGNAPFEPRGCMAQAWSVAEVLRVWRLIEAQP